MGNGSSRENSNSGKLRKFFVEVIHAVLVAIGSNTIVALLFRISEDGSMEVRGGLSGESALSYTLEWRTFG